MYFFVLTTILNLFTGKMENILDENSVTDQTQILLVNAAYFVTNWMKKFPEAEIKECPFKVNKVCSVKKQQQKTPNKPTNQTNKRSAVKLWAKEIPSRENEKCLLLPRQS